METFMFIFAIIVGSVIFVILNRVMDISYFGFAGMASLWLTCTIVGTVACVLLVGLVAKHFGLVLVVTAIIGAWIYHSKKKSGTNQEDDSSELTKTKEEE